MNKQFQNGDLIEGIAATTNGYVTLKVFEKQPVTAPAIKKKRTPRVPAATASTSKGKSLVSPFWTLIFSLTPLPETIV